MRPDTDLEVSDVGQEVSRVRTVGVLSVCEAVGLDERGGSLGLAVRSSDSLCRAVNSRGQLQLGQDGAEDA